MFKRGLLHQACKFLNHIAFHSCIDLISIPLVYLLYALHAAVYGITRRYVYKQ